MKPRDLFTHTTGRVDGRDAPLVSARSPIRRIRENRLIQPGWVQVMARVKGEGMLAASQATRLPVSA